MNYTYFGTRGRILTFLDFFLLRVIAAVLCFGCFKTLLQSPGAQWIWRVQLTLWGNIFASVAKATDFCIKPRGYFMLVWTLGTAGPMIQNHLILVQFDTKTSTFENRNKVRPNQSTEGNLCCASSGTSHSCAQHQYFVVLWHLYQRWTASCPLWRCGPWIRRYFCFWVLCQLFLFLFAAGGGTCSLDFWPFLEASVVFCLAMTQVSYLEPCPSWEMTFWSSKALPLPSTKQIHYWPKYKHRAWCTSVERSANGSLELCTGSVDLFWCQFRHLSMLSWSLSRWHGWAWLTLSTGPNSACDCVLVAGQAAVLRSSFSLLALHFIFIPCLLDWHVLGMGDASLEISEILHVKRNCTRSGHSGPVTVLAGCVALLWIEFSTRQEK